MDAEKSARLLLRQLQDIQSQADRIVKGERCSESIENFARYSDELRRYILSKAEYAALHSRAEELTGIKYERMHFRLWHILVLPLWLLFLYKDHVRKVTLANQINTLQGKYARLETLLKEQMNGFK